MKIFKVIINIFLILTLFVLSNCSSKDQKIVKPQKIIPLEILYNEAYSNFENGKYNEAVKLFEDVQKNYSYTEWAAKALLLKSYIKYSTLSSTGLKEDVIIVFGIIDTSSGLIV